MVSQDIILQYMQLQQAIGSSLKYYIIFIILAVVAVAIVYDRVKCLTYYSYRNTMSEMVEYIATIIFTAMILLMIGGFVLEKHYVAQEDKVQLNQLKQQYPELNAKEIQIKKKNGNIITYKLN